MNLISRKFIISREINNFKKIQDSNLIMSNLRDFLQSKLPKPIYKFLLQIFRLRLCFYNMFKPVGSFTILKMVVLEYFNPQKTIYIPNLKIYTKCNYFTLTTLIEIYNRELYKELHNLNCVLDVGSFIGESSIYLIENNNKKVISIEASRDKFKLLKKNIEGYKEKIIGLNKALVNSGEKEALFYSSGAYDFCSSTISQKRLTHKEVVKTIHIKDLISKYQFDGLKMDIEGGEFEILEFYLKHKNKFTYKKGIIEFHFSTDYDKRIKIFKEFFEFLNQNTYKIKLFDNYNKRVTLKEIENKKIQCLNLLFEK